MSWIKKQFYTRGPGSPGSLAKTFARSFQEGLRLGMDAKEANYSIIQNYLNNFQRMGLDVSFITASEIIHEVEDDPALAAFALVVIGNSGNAGAIQKLKEDIRLILEIIVNEQNKILNNYRTVEELKGKLEQISLL